MQQFAASWRVTLDTSTAATTKDPCALHNFGMLQTKDRSNIHQNRLSDIPECEQFGDVHHTKPATKDQLIQ